MLKALAVGVVWGAIAPIVHIAMFRGGLPAPAFDVLGVLRVVLDLPFIAALALLSLLGMPSASLAVVVLAALVSGCALVLVAYASWHWRLLRARARWFSSRTSPR